MKRIVKFLRLLVSHYWRRNELFIPDHRGLCGYTVSADDVIELQDGRSKAHREMIELRVRCGRVEAESKRREDRDRALIKRLREGRAKELEQARADARSIVEGLSHLSFDRITADRYVMSIEFDQRMFGPFSESADLSHLARYMSEQVYREIASSRFIKTAEEARRARDLAVKQRTDWKARREDAYGDMDGKPPL